MKQFRAAIAALAMGASIFTPIAGAAPETRTAPAPKVLDIWPGIAPGSENWTQREISGNFGDNRFPNPIVRNVSHPTLTVYLPDPARATGTGVVVAPGGGFMVLSMKSEGSDVAEWLAAHGIAAFVLKYRTRATPVPEAEMYQTLANAASEMRTAQDSAPAAAAIQAANFATADAVQALSIVWSHAREWHLDPQRIGIVGFSAGARVATGALLQADPAKRPSFAAPIYGGIFDRENIPIPTDLPPVFTAVSGDDNLGLQSALDLVAKLRASRTNLEFHLFNRGGHGYGLNKQGTSSDHWIDSFYWWMEANGLLQPRKP